MPIIDELEDNGMRQQMIDKAKKKSTKYKIVQPTNFLKILAAGYVKYFGLMSIEKINCGLCELFARDFCSVITDAKYGWVDEFAPEDYDCDDAHCVIKYCNKYYDAECPEGVECIADLPFFIRHEKSKMEQWGSNFPGNLRGTSNAEGI